MWSSPQYARLPCTARSGVGFRNADLRSVPFLRYRGARPPLFFNHEREILAMFSANGHGAVHFFVERGSLNSPNPIARRLPMITSPLEESKTVDFWVCHPLWPRSLGTICLVDCFLRYGVSVLLRFTVDIFVQLRKTVVGCFGGRELALP